MSQDVGLNNETLRKGNRGLVLRLIVTNNGISRTEIAKSTGLTKMAVSNIVGELIERGMVREVACPRASGHGRTPVGLVLSEDAPKVIGLAVLRGECTAILSDLKLRPIAQATLPMDEAHAHDLKGTIREVVDQVMPSDRSSVFGFGVSSIGPVDIATGTILDAPNFYGVHDVCVKQILEDLYGLPVSFDSQYNCAALGERWFIQSRDVEDFVFVGISSGVGSGIMSGGEVLRYANGLTSELGHMSIDWHGRLCHCGNRGCIEAYANARVVEQGLREMSGLDLDFRGFCELVASGERPDLERGFDEMAEALGVGLAAVSNLVNPQAIIIGDEGAWLPDSVLARIQELTNRYKVTHGYDVRVVRPHFGARAQVDCAAGPLIYDMLQGTFL